MTTLVREARRERLEHRPGGNAAMLSAGHLALDVLTGSIAVLLPTLQRRFDLDAAEVALLVGIGLIAASLTQPLLGALADRFGRTGSPRRDRPSARCCSARSRSSRRYPY